MGHALFVLAIGVIHACELFFVACAHAIPVSFVLSWCRLFMRSSSQGNGWADVVIADYHYYGRGGLPQSHAAAVEKYTAACNNHVPEVSIYDFFVLLFYTVALRARGEHL